MNVDIFLIGGHYTHFHESTVGVYTEKWSLSFISTTPFFGCLGHRLMHQMAYNDDIDTVPVKEIAMNCSKQEITFWRTRNKLKTSFCRLAPLSAFRRGDCHLPARAQHPAALNFIVVQDE